MRDIPAHGAVDGADAGGGGAGGAFADREVHGPSTARSVSTSKRARPPSSRSRHCLPSCPYACNRHAALGLAAGDHHRLGRPHEGPGLRSRTDQRGRPSLTTSRRPRRRRPPHERRGERNGGAPAATSLPDPHLGFRQGLRSGGWLVRQGSQGRDSRSTMRCHLASSVSSIWIRLARLRRPAERAGSPRPSPAPPPWRRPHQPGSCPAGTGGPRLGAGEGKAASASHLGKRPAAGAPAPDAVGAATALRGPGAAGCAATLSRPDGPRPRETPWPARGRQCCRAVKASDVASHASAIPDRDDEGGEESKWAATRHLPTPKERSAGIRFSPESHSGAMSPS